MTIKRARRLAAELARRGLLQGTAEDLQSFLDLLDPTGDDEELVEQVAEWIDEMFTLVEARAFAGAVIEGARAASRRQPP
ncbi:MAG: hypothetical protein IT562_10690 [Alphaproteobacteria bacterium]|nr:hypothetical protein [Alphaproteobacteria bacterium]